MGSMQNTECHASQHHLLESGMTMSCHYNQIDPVFLGIVHNAFGRPVGLNGLRFYLDPFGSQLGRSLCQILS